MNWNVLGHQKQLEFLNNSLAKGKIAHAYIFAGPERVGKKTIARKFAQSLLCQNTEGKFPCDACDQCKSFVVASNADYIDLASEEDLKIEKIRELIYKLSLKPYLAKYKVAVIDNAENLTIEASNALLKLLEEPKPNTVIILVTSNPYKLLRTISSRAQKINFGLVDSGLFAQLPAWKNLQSQKQELVKKFANGRPGMAIKMAQENESLDKAIEQLNIYMKPDLVEKLKLAYQIAEMETTDIKSTLDMWLANFEQSLSNQDFSVKNKIDKIIRARKFLDQNVNTKLLLSELMLNS